MALNAGDSVVIVSGLYRGRSGVVRRIKDRALLINLMRPGIDPPRVEVSLKQIRPILATQNRVKVKQSEASR